MELINTTIKSDNRIEREEEWVFQSKDNLGLKNYQEIKNKFYGIPPSHIYIKIVFNEAELTLFSNTLIIGNKIEPIIGEEFIEDVINKTIEEYNGKFIIKLVVNIMYYKRLALWDYKLD